MSLSVHAFRNDSDAPTETLNLTLFRPSWHTLLSNGHTAFSARTPVTASPAFDPVE
ncbi:hypothetical protein SAMN05446589_0721 [Streptomyces sp. OV198]|nr:hypothetical protein BX281_2300 [Streptomyces sp. Ag82_O1-15]SOE54629.1 hypothetical protein SAMN05446589_0721 [Streptomyces sp. OV198]